MVCMMLSLADGNIGRLLSKLPICQNKFPAKISSYMVYYIYCLNHIILYIIWLYVSICIAAAQRKAWHIHITWSTAHAHTRQMYNCTLASCICMLWSTCMDNTSENSLDSSEYIYYTKNRYNSVKEKWSESSRRSYIEHLTEAFLSLLWCINDMQQLKQIHQHSHMYR